jgi:hypothetical protein
MISHSVNERGKQKSFAWAGIRCPCILSHLVHLTILHAMSELSTSVHNILQTQKIGEIELHGFSWRIMGLHLPCCSGFWQGCVFTIKKFRSIDIYFLRTECYSKVLTKTIVFALQVSKLLNSNFLEFLSLNK